MQRTVLFLTGWLAAFALLGGGVYAWMGASLANLAFFDSRSDQPYAVLEFIRADTPAMLGSYEGPLRELVEGETAQLYPSYELKHLSRGTVADEWLRLTGYVMNEAGAMVEVMTSTAYRDLEDTAEDVEVFKLGTYELPPLEGQGDSLVLVLAQLRETSNLDPLSSFTALLDGGRIVVDTTPDNLVSDREWDRLIAIDFANQDAAVNWLSSPDVELETEILNSKVRHLAIMLYAKS